MAEAGPAEAGRITLTAADGEPVAAYHAPPGDARRGGLVILHAIWGVTPHIRALSDQLAEQGYEVIAPSLLDAADAPFPTADLDPPNLDARMTLGLANGWGAAALPACRRRSTRCPRRARSSPWASASAAPRPGWPRPAAPA